MKKNEEYWLNLYKEGKIKIDFKNGIVYSCLSGKFKELCKNKDIHKYKRSSAGPSRKERYHILLHRLIWICIYGDIPKNIEINHKNGIKGDNKLNNLELTTKSGNALHSIRILGNKTGVLFGENSPKSKLKYSEVEDIKNNYKKGMNTMKDFSIKYNVSISAISDIIHKRNWDYDKAVLLAN